MGGKMTLEELIDWLKKQPSHLHVETGFGEPHSDRGSYSELAFKPDPDTTFGEMLRCAEYAMGRTFQGYKGGDFVMQSYTPVHIGEWGTCGEPITKAHFRCWEMETREERKKPRPSAAKKALEEEEYVEELEQYATMINDELSEFWVALLELWYRRGEAISGPIFRQRLMEEIRTQVENVRRNAVVVEKEAEPQPRKYKVLEWHNMGD